MKKKFAAKPIFPTILASISIAFLAMFILVLYVNIDKLSTDFTLGSLFSLLLFMLILGFAFAQVTFFLAFYFKTAEIDNQSFALFELHKLRTTTDAFDAIMGYSKSEVYFGKYGFSTPSLVIYYKSGKVAELLDIFVSNLDIFEKELQDRGVAYLGTEPYNTGVFVREYKFKSEKL